MSTPTVIEVAVAGAPVTRDPFVDDLCDRSLTSIAQTAAAPTTPPPRAVDPR